MKRALERAADASTDDERLASLLEAWRERRLARTADLVATVARRLPSREPPKAAAAEAQERWLRAASEPAARDLDGLLADIVTARREASTDRVAAIGAWPDDPRIAPGLLALVRKRPFTSVPARPFWTAVFRELRRRAAAGDLAEIERLREGARAGVTAFDDYVAAKLTALARAIEQRDPPPAPTPDETALLDRLAASLANPTEERAQKTADDFLAAIWRDPADDGLREVFADWLLERGDPRGELIALQLGRARGTASGEGAKRERELLAKHARAWMGPLEPAVHGTSFRFDRGFLYACKIAWRRLVATPGLAHHPAWATVREYELDPAGERAADAWLDHMIALGAKRR